MDQDVGAFAQLADVVGDIHAAVHRLLVVADVRHDGAAHLDAIAVGEPDVRDAAHLDLGVADRDVGVGDVVEADVAAEVGEAHREVRRAHEVLERLLERAVVLRRSVDVELCARTVDRDEERQPLHVVPMEVGDERGPAEAAVLRERVAPVAQARAEVEDDRLAARRFERDARGVAAVAKVAPRTGTGSILGPRRR